jgi:hypothetical protein
LFVKYVMIYKSISLVNQTIVVRTSSHRRELGVNLEMWCGLGVRRDKAGYGWN